MDKLTWYDNDGGIMCRRGYEVALARLASYEATGLMPEQVVNAKTIIESAFADDTSKAERIRKLLAADKEDRVMILPCKVYETDGVRVYEHAVRGIIYRTAGGPDFDESTIGKSIFLTREEAERAMEGKRNG